MLHLIALGFLAAIVRDPRLLDELERDSSPVADWSDVGRPNNVMPTPLSNVEPPPSSYPQHATQPRDHSLIYRKYNMSLHHCNRHIMLGIIITLHYILIIFYTLKKVYFY